MAMKCSKCRQAELAYKKGIGEGYKQGIRDGRKDGSTLIAKDLEWFHARLAVTLKKKRHWKDETIMQLIKQMVVVGDESFDIFAEFLELTGIEFRQHDEEGEE